MTYETYGKDHHIRPRQAPPDSPDEQPPEPDTEALNEAHASGLLQFEEE